MSRQELGKGKLRSRNNRWMFLALVPEEIVATRKSLKIIAARVGAIEAYLC